MPKHVEKLRDKQVNAILKNGIKGSFAVGGVAGLALQIRPPHAASWILRTVTTGGRRSIGLGGYPEVSLANAREEAGELKRKIKRDNYDPIESNKLVKVEAKKEQYKALTFQQLAEEYIDKRSREFKTQQQVRKLTNILESYAYPTLAKMRLTDIDLNVIHHLLVQQTVVVDRKTKEKNETTLWIGKTETANRLRMYLNQIFDIAIARGIYTELNPARWDGGLKTILAAPQKVNKTEHHKALAVEDMPEFWAKLTKQDWMGAKVLQFGILTGTRSAEMRGALWSEIDIDANVWRIPAERMKGEYPKDHNIPLSSVALNLLEMMPRTSDCIFPNTKGAPVSDATVSNAPKRLGYDVTAHGFRSTFKEWSRKYVKFAHDVYEDDVSELALAHVNSDSTRAAYARDELIDERRPLMDEWAQYCVNGIKDNVVKLQGVG
jgi:integrase